MKALGIDAASRRTFRFQCGACGSGGATFSETSPTLAGTTESKRKRQRRMETSIVDVHLVERLCSLDKVEIENDNDTHYGLFVWPSALVLSHFVAREAEWLCRDKVILELGCGTGFPSILASLCGATKVYLTDRPDAVDIACNAAANLALNGIEKNRAAFIPLTWGDMHVSDAMHSVFQTVQVILAADCFYRSEDFDKVLATVALIGRCSVAGSCTCYFTYHLRSINRCIAPLLSRWGLTATSIDTTNLFSDDEENAETVQDVDSIYLYQVNAQR